MKSKVSMSLNSQDFHEFNLDVAKLASNNECEAILRILYMSNIFISTFLELICI